MINVKKTHGSKDNYIGIIVEMYFHLFMNDTEFTDELTDDLTDELVINLMTNHCESLMIIFKKTVGSQDDSIMESSLSKFILISF